MKNATDCPYSVFERIEKDLREEYGYNEEEINKLTLHHHPDPRVPGTHAIRIIKEDSKYPIDLLYVGQYNDPIEECEWEVFPPVSGELKFFT